MESRSYFSVEVDMASSSENAEAIRGELNHLLETRPFGVATAVAAVARIAANIDLGLNHKVDHLLLSAASELGLQDDDAEAVGNAVQRIRA